MEPRRERMASLDRALRFLDRILLVLAGVAALGLMAVATMNVCLRIFHMPYRGAYEVVSFLGAVVIAFALSYTQRRRSNIVVDIVSARYPEGVKRAMDAIGSVVSAGFFAIIAWMLVQWGVRIARSGEVSETLKVIHYPFIFCVGVGFVVLSLTLLLQCLMALQRKGWRAE
jgi:TRAP-type C4-dicarboxylate transport system permease small subunit